jgi:HSP20 family protein
MGEDMDRAFGRLLPSQSPRRRGWLPPADIYETDDDVVIELDAPGCESENLAVEAIDGQLVIVGERHPVEQATRRYRSERWSGKFVRSFTLQPNMRTDDIHADYNHGVLTSTCASPKRPSQSGSPSTTTAKNLPKTPSQPPPRRHHAGVSSSHRRSPKRHHPTSETDTPQRRRIIQPPRGVGQSMERTTTVPSSCSGSCQHSATARRMAMEVAAALVLWRCATA